MLLLLLFVVSHTVVECWLDLELGAWRRFRPDGWTDRVIYDVSYDSNFNH